MKSLLNKFLNKKLEVPEPARYPDFNNIVEWMEQKVAYHEYKYPDKMDSLFNPSSGDYLPLLISVGTSNERFKKNIEYYRKIKSKYPEVCEKAKAGFLTYSYYREGDPLDYPKE